MTDELAKPTVYSPACKAASAVGAIVSGLQKPYVPKPDDQLLLFVHRAGMFYIL